MPTMSDVARHAGVSATTVSFVLNGKEANFAIPEITRDRVLSAARAIGYRRNELAHAAITGKNRVLGFLVHKPENESAARILSGALAQDEEAGYTIKVLRLADKETLDRATIERCFELRLAGVMVLYRSDGLLEILHAEMSKGQVPVASSIPKATTERCRVCRAVCSFPITIWLSTMARHCGSWASRPKATAR